MKVKCLIFDISSTVKLISKDFSLLVDVKLLRTNARSLV